MSPRLRRAVALVLLVVVAVGWPATHVLMVLTKPPGASGWVFHLLLALSWGSLLLGAAELLNTADVRVQQEEGE